MAVGFLPIPTNTPPLTEVPFYSHERSDLCPGFARQACLAAGDEVNLYQALSLERSVALSVFQGGATRWVLDASKVERVLRELDQEVILDGWALSSDPSVFVLTVVWPRGEGLPHYEESFDQFDLVVGGDQGLIGSRTLNVQWRVSEGFPDLVFASLSDMTPTPSPLPATATPYPSATPTPTFLPDVTVFFEHPEDRLQWDGPDAAVYSLGRGHCEAPQEVRDAYGSPAVIVVGDASGFQFTAVVRREEGWRWTGYEHGDWQIWQGTDPRVAYLAHSREPRIAFEYRAFLCF